MGIIEIQQLRNIIPVFFIETELNGYCVIPNSGIKNEDIEILKYITFENINFNVHYPDFSHSELKIIA